MAKVKVLEVDVAAIRRGQEQAEWRRRAEAAARADRRRRAEDLVGRQPAIQTAVNLYRNLGSAQSARLRTSSLRIDPPRALPPALGGEPWPQGTTRRDHLNWDLDTRRPIGRLAAHRGPALNTYLSILSALHLEQPAAPANRHPTASVQYPRDVPWARLCGRDHSSPRARRARMGRDLTALAATQLIKLTTLRGRATIEEFLILNESGDGLTYTFPEAHDEVLELPASFFSNGWHLVLHPPELVMLLTVMDAYARHKGDRAGWEEDGVPLTQHERWQEYGVSGETYQSIHMLEELELIGIRDPMDIRLRGKFTPPTPEQRSEYEAKGHAFSPEPYQLRPTPSGFDRPALYRLSECLDKNELPPRMID